MLRKYVPLLLTVVAGGVAARAQVLNFHNGYNYANYAGGGAGPGAPLYGSMTYIGQGPYSDPGNNIWNAFGGGFSPTANGYSPGDFGHTTQASRQDSGAIRFSNGSISGTTLTLNYGFDNGGLLGTGNTFQGQPNFLLGTEAGVNGSSPGIGTAAAPEGSFILNNVPTGKTYNLYLIGQNFDADRGALFSLAPANGGTFVGGINGTVNNGTKNAFALGVNYVIVTGVTPDSNGQITGFFTPNPNDQLQGEGSFDGLQLVVIPEPSMFALIGLGLGGLLCYRRRK